MSPSFGSWQDAHEFLNYLLNEVAEKLEKKQKEEAKKEEARKLQAEETQKRREMEAKMEAEIAMHAVQRRTALQQLRQTIARIAKGELGMRVVLWKGKLPAAEEDVERQCGGRSDAEHEHGDATFVAYLAALIVGDADTGYYHAAGTAGRSSCAA